MRAVGNTELKFVMLKSILSGGRGGGEGERGGEESDIKERIKVDNYLSISNTQQNCLSPSQSPLSWWNYFQVISLEQPTASPPPSPPGSCQAVTLPLIISSGEERPVTLLAAA